MRLLAALLALCLVVPSTRAQPADWGDVPEAHAELSVYASDSAAAAVVLFDVGTMTLGRGVRFERHRRVKLFSEAGYEHATVSFFLYTRNRMQLTERIEAHTLVPDGEGGYARVKMTENAVFHEPVGDTYERITFTLPALQPGAIIEYRYATDSQAINLLPTWYFQDDIPTLHSEIEVRSMTRRTYGAQSQGAAPYSVEESGTRTTFEGDQGYNRWVRVDVPAFRKAPFLTTPEDYLYKLEFMLGDGSPQRWHGRSRYLDEHARFGGVLRSTRRLRRLAEELVADHAEPRARAQAIYDYVRTTYEHNGWRGIWTSDRPHDLLDTHTGSIAEINLLLTQLLREADLDAQPALVSTRGHGRLRPYTADLGQFNYVLTRLALPDTTVWLDATDALLAFGMVRPEARREQAWVPDPDDPAWVPLTAPRHGEQSLSANVYLAPEGDLTVRLRLQAEGYDALRMRQAIRDDGLDAFVATLVQDLPEARADSARATHLDQPEQPLEVYATVHAEGYAQRAGDLLLFRPTLLQRQMPGAFRSPERAYPVDFGETAEARMTVQVLLPDGFVVDDTPEPTAFRTPGGALHYACRLTVGEGQLLVRRKVTREVTRFDVEAYPDLRAFFERVAAADEAVVVLKRDAAEQTSVELSSEGDE
ncbi:MAG: DUF3857 domain-containing protein [Bacteroidota bacterium]